MDEIRALRQEVASLKKEVIALHTQIDQVDDWANGIHMAVEDLMLVLLRDHPKAQQVGEQLKKSYDRFHALRAHPRRKGRDDPAIGVYESRKMLYAALAIYGIWPNVDSRQFAEQSWRQGQHQT